MKPMLAALAMLAIAGPASAQAPDDALQAKLKAQIQAAVAAEVQGEGAFYFSSKPSKPKENASQFLQMGAGKQLVAVACEAGCDVDIFLADRNDEVSGNDVSSAATPIVRVNPSRGVEAMLNVNMKACEAAAGCSFAIARFWAK